jgi:hypothetical protein
MTADRRSMRVADDTPENCPVCDDGYDSVSEHDAGLMVNLIDNERYRRVCFDPVGVDGEPRVRFFHHTHEQVDAAGRSDTPVHRD